MERVTAHADGRSLVLHQQVELAPGRPVDVDIMITPRQGRASLHSMADWAETFLANLEVPGDVAEQHEYFPFERSE